MKAEYCPDELGYFFQSIEIWICLLQVIAEHLSVEEVAGIKEAFQIMDNGNKGKINLEQLRTGLHKLGQQIPDPDLQILMEAVSNNRKILVLNSSLSLDCIIKRGRG